MKELIVGAAVQLAKCFKLLRAVHFDAVVELFVEKVIDLVVGRLVRIVHHFTLFRWAFIGQIQQVLCFEQRTNHFCGDALTTANLRALTDRTLALTALLLIYEHRYVERQLGKFIKHGLRERHFDVVERGDLFDL